MANYFTKTIIPDVINGDVSTVVGNTVGSDSGDAVFGAADILFDWTAVDIPVKTTAIVDALVYMIGTDGGAQADVDFNLLIAKSLDGVAPTSLGNVNGGRTGCFELSQVLIGCMKFEGDTNRVGILHVGLGSIFHFNGSGNNGQHGPICIQPEPNPGLSGSAELNRIYVAGIAGGVFNFSTGVKPDAQATTSTATISVDGVDPRKCFQVGDTVYTNTDDTALGTVKSLASGSIVLNANLAAQVEDNEEIVNANPIRIQLGFERVVR